MKVAKSVSLPASVLRCSPTISPMRQQQLYDKLSHFMLEGDRKSAEKLLPAHPREERAFKSYAEILSLCYETMLGIDPAKNLHRYHALIAVRWLQGWSLPRIIDAQIRYNPSTSTRTTIRKVLETIEQKIRFEVVRAFNAYNAILSILLVDSGFGDLAKHIIDMTTLLELGGSDDTMLALISLGISRSTAAKLNDINQHKQLNKQEVARWLVEQSFEDYGLSEAVRNEILLAKKRVQLSSRV